MDYAVDYEDVVSYRSYVDDTGCRGRPPRRWTLPNRYARCRGQEVLLQRTLSRDPRAAESGFHVGALWRSRNRDAGGPQVPPRALLTRTPNWNSAIWDCFTNRYVTTMRPFGTYAWTDLRRHRDVLSGKGHSAASTQLFPCCLHGTWGNCSAGALLRKVGVTGSNNMRARHGQKIDEAVL
jgi:hypothetical protein